MMEIFKANVEMKYWQERLSSKYELIVSKYSK